MIFTQFTGVLENECDMRKFLFLVAFLIFGLFAAGCAAETGIAAEPISTGPAAEPIQAEQAQRQSVEDIVYAWIECEDQCDRQLEQVLAAGPEANQLLKTTLIEGPPPIRREEMRLYLHDTYNELVQYGKTHPEAAFEVDEEEYISIYFENYVALYQIRSAIALAESGDPASVELITEALKSIRREDVQHALEDTLRNLR